MRPPPLPRSPFVALAAFVALLAAEACSPAGSAVPHDATTPGAGTVAAATSESGFPREITGADGALCRLVAPPRRIVATNASAFDDLAPLVEPDRIAARPSTARQYGNFDVEREGWRDVPEFVRFEGETLLALDPDLIIAHSWQSAATLATLRNAGIPVLTIDVVSRPAQILSVVRMLGAATGEEARAEEIVRELERRMADLAASSGAHRGLRALSYSNLGTGGWAAADGSTMDVVFELAGLRNAADDLGLSQHAKLSFEQLLVLDPDLIVVGGDDADGYRGGQTLALLRETPALAGLRAVREDRILILPSRLHSTNSSHLVTAAEVLAERADALLERLASETASNAVGETGR